MFNNRTKTSFVRRRIAGRITDGHLTETGWQPLLSPVEEQTMCEMDIAIQDNLTELLLPKKKVRFAHETEEPTYRRTRHFRRTSARYRPGKYASDPESAGYLNTSGPDDLLNPPTSNMPVDFFRWHDELVIANWHRDAENGTDYVAEPAKEKRLSRSPGNLGVEDAYSVDSAAHLARLSTNF